MKTPSPQDVVDQLDDEITQTGAKIAATDTEIADLKRRITEGDTSVTPDDVPQRLQLSEHLNLLIDGMRARRAAAKAAARLTRLQDLRDEIDAALPTLDDGIAGLIKSAQDAQAAVLAALEARASTLHGWRTRIVNEQVPAHTSPAPEPSPAHAGLASSVSELIVGTHRVTTHDSIGSVSIETTRRNLLGRITDNAIATHGGHLDDVRPIPLTRQTPDLPAGALFYESPTNGVQMFDDASRIPPLGRDYQQVDRDRAIQRWWADADAAHLLNNATTGDQA